MSRFFSVSTTSRTVCRLAVGLIALAQALSGAATQPPPAPTRMQLCAADLKHLAANKRTVPMRECLVHRTEAERLIARSCRQKLASIKTETAQERLGLQSKCVNEGLQVKYEDLPGKPKAAEPVTASSKPASSISGASTAASATKPAIAAKPVVATASQPKK